MLCLSGPGSLLAFGMFRSDGVPHLSVLLQRDGAVVVGVVHVEEDWKQKGKCYGPG